MNAVNFLKKMAAFFIGAFSMNKPLVLPGVDKKALANKTSKSIIEMVWQPHHEKLRRF